MRYKLTVIILAESEKDLAERVADITARVGVLGARLSPEPLTGPESRRIMGPMLDMVDA